MLGYRVARSFVFALARVAWRVRIVGAGRLPRTGPYVLAPSHRSNLDPFFAALVTTRRVRFMAKEEIWRSKLLGRLAGYFGAFPVARGGRDRAALRTAAACLDAGEPLVVFPEGTRRTGPAIEGLHDGAAYLATQHGVPIVPVGIAGSEEILGRGRRAPRFHPVLVLVGEPLEPPRRDGAVPRAEAKALTSRLEAALQQAFDEAHALRGRRTARRRRRRGR